MSKERLEEIRDRMIVESHHFKYLNSEKGYWENVYKLLEQDMKYLFDTINEQAERVQELEEIIEVDGLAFNYLENMYINLEQQNKRYREALEKIDDIMRLKRRWNKEDMHIMNELKVLEESE